MVCSFIPNCGTCRYCATGRQSICDMGATILEGYLPGPRFPITGPRGDYGAMCMLGTFSQYGVISQTSCVKVDDDLPLDKAVLVGCGVPTGWGSAVNSAALKAGDTAVIFGVGGIGINAVQGARHAGAKNVIAIDPLENKREKAMELGATHAFATAEEAMPVLTDLTRGQMADAAILTPGLVTSEIVTQGFHSVGKGGVVVVTGLNKLMEQTIELPGTILTLYRKTVKGSLFGDCNPTTDIPKILGLYQSGDLKLDELITRTYTLEQVQRGVRRPPGRQERARDRGPRPLVSLTEIDEYAGPAGVVGRTRETELLRAALDSGAHVVLEGPPGTGKSTLLRAVAASTGRPFHFVEGNADLTPEPADRPLRPGPGAQPRVPARRLRRRTARRGAAGRGAALPRGAQPGARGDAERPPHRDVGGRAAPCRGSGRSAPSRDSGWSPP